MGGGCSADVRYGVPDLRCFFLCGRCDATIQTPKMLSMHCLFAHTYVGPGPTVIILIGWLFYLVPLLIVAGPVWFFGRKRANWTIGDFSVVVFPYVARCVASFWYLQSVAGFVVGGVLMGCLASLIPVLRLIVGTRVNEKALAISLLALLCFLPVGLTVLEVLAHPPTAVWKACLMGPD